MAAYLMTHAGFPQCDGSHCHDRRRQPSLVLAVRSTWYTTSTLQRNRCLPTATVPIPPPTVVVPAVAATSLLRYTIWPKGSSARGSSCTRFRGRGAPLDTPCAEIGRASCRV